MDDSICRSQPRMEKEIRSNPVRTKELFSDYKNNSSTIVVGSDVDDGLNVVKEEIIDLQEDPLALDHPWTPVHHNLSLMPSRAPMTVVKSCNTIRLDTCKPNIHDGRQNPPGMSTGKSGALDSPKDHPLVVLRALTTVSKVLSSSKSPSSLTVKDLGCKECPYRTNRSNNLARHMQTMHSILSEPQECCSQTFHTRHDHQRHNHEFHVASKFPCHFPSCQKAHVVFERRGLLKRHVIGVHQRQKPFLCSYCSYQSSHKSNLDRHCRTQHASYLLKTTTLSPSKCSITIQMDPADIVKFKLDDDTFKVRPRVKQPDENDLIIKEELQDWREERQTSFDGKLVIKSEPLEN